MATTSPCDASISERAPRSQNLRQEPDAVVPHVAICAGAVRKDGPYRDHLEEEEWLAAVDIETDVSHIILSLYVNKVDGWIGIGSYDDILALSLCGASGNAIAFTTAADYIEMISPEVAMVIAQEAAIGQHLRIEGVTFASNSLI